MGLRGLTGPPDGGQCGDGVWCRQQPGGHRRRDKRAEESPDKPVACGQGEDPGDRQRGEARETGGGASGAEGDHRSGPPAGCQDEVVDKGQGSQTLWIRSGLCKSDFGRVMRV